jgi:hypothetical protein
LVRRASLIAAIALAAAAPQAHAADPVMPLAEVQRGMACTGLSVIRGTEISSFGVEVLDVIAPETGVSGPRILVRVSGPAVDATGVGPGFSGSPIICGGRTAGAISEGIGEYGNHVVLATPIEEMLRLAPAGAAATRLPRSARRDRPLLRAAEPLSTPLTVSGFSGRTLGLLSRAARRAGRPLLASPAGPAGGFAEAPLVPGAAAAAAISTGDLAIGAVGTVSYRDGDRIWAFGHALDGLGRRSLFLTDTYVFGIIGNPLGVADLGAVTYKLASPDGHIQGRMTNDGFAAISGVAGAGPTAIPLRVTARERGGDTVTFDSLLADERPLGLGAGISIVAPLAVSQGLERVMRDAGPATFSMCARFRVRQLRRPMSFCNAYFAVESAVSDMAEAGSLLDYFELAPLDVERVDLSIRAQDGVTSDVLVRADGPRAAPAGGEARVRLTLQRRRGGRRALTVTVPIPRGMSPGEKTLTLRGNSSDGAFEDELVLELLGGLTGSREARASAEPRSPRELAERVRALHQPRGIEARFRGRPPRLVHRSGDVSFEGRARLRLRVLRAR